MVTYSVEFGQMQESIEQLSQVFQRLTQIGEDLQARVKAGTVEFQGNTKDNFDDAQKNYMSAHAELTTALQNANKALDEVHHAYTLAESKGSGLWAR